MVKVFYVGGAGSTVGMLRAVLSEDWQATQLSQSQEFTYVGSNFPLSGKTDPPATIIEISGRLGTLSLENGFYRAERAPDQFEETLRALRN